MEPNQTVGDLADVGGLDRRELQGLLGNQVGVRRQLIWDYVQRNFDDLSAKIPGARGLSFAAMLPLVSGAFCDSASATQVEAFFSN
jgi:hypothetical protein